VASSWILFFIYQCGNIGASLIISWLRSSWFLPITWNEINIEGMALLWRYRHHYECEERAENAITKWLRGMFLTALQSLVEAYRSVRWLFWRKCTGIIVFLGFSELKWFWEQFETIVYIYIYVYIYLYNILCSFVFQVAIQKFKHQDI